MEITERLVVYKRLLCAVGGMVFALGAYLIYSTFFGDCNVCGTGALEETTLSSPTVVQTASLTPALITAEISQSAYLGVDITDIDDVLAENLDLKGKTGVFVNNVIPGSPAEEAGLKRSDVLAAFNNRDTEDVENFKELIKEVEPGDTVRIVYVRDGKKRNTYATLAPASFFIKTANTVDEDSTDWGVSLAPLTDEARTMFNIPENIDGVIILSLTQGGIADQAGLEAGDVIAGINQIQISGMSDFFDAALDDTDDTALLDVYSNGRLRYAPIDSSGIQDVRAAVGSADVTVTQDSTAVRSNADSIPPGWYDSVIRWVPWVGLAGLIFTGLLYLSILAYPAGEAKMRSVAEKIRSGAMIFLNREYRIILSFMLIVFFILLFLMGLFTALAFMLGGAASMTAGWIGIKAATIANVRTCQAAKDRGLWQALNIAFRGGSVMGISIAALGILGISIICLFTKNNLVQISTIAIGFAFGASTVALFARVGGGIFTKGADIGADLAGKIEAGIPEDDPRNPGVIADNVGDCVGDTAGMGADLFESYAGSIIAAMAIGVTASDCVACLSLPLLVAAIGLISSIIAVFSMKFFTNSTKPQTALRYSCGIANVLLLIGTYILVRNLFGDLNHFWVIFAGITCGVLMGAETEYFTSGSPVESIAKASETGIASNILTGFSIGFKSSIFPIITLCATIFLAHMIDGLYGIALAAVGMLSTTGVIMSIDAYGPIADTAGGIAEMCGLDKKVRAITDELDFVGNTTAAIGKGFAIGSAALTAIAFFSAYLNAAGLLWLDLKGFDTSTGILIGAVVPFGIAALMMDSVTKVADRMVNEIRRQFKNVKGLLEGKAEPDANKCIDIVSRGSLKEIAIPGVIAIGLPLVVGFTMGKNELGGFLFGAMAVGTILGLVMTNSGAAWDNAKKRIEQGAHGGKGSSAHKASIVGDTVGDPLKDTAGPALNIVMKLMAVVSLIFVTFMR